MDFEDTAHTNRLGINTGMNASELAGKAFESVGRPFKESKHLPPAAIQTHLGFQNDFSSFIDSEVSLTPKLGKLLEIRNSLLELRSRLNQKAALNELMKLAGNLIFLFMRCFNKMAHGGLQPFF